MNKEAADILKSGTPEEKKYLMEFDLSMSNEVILDKFKYYCFGMFPEDEIAKDSPRHRVMMEKTLNSYRGLINYRNIASRGFAKTTKFKKLLSFVLLCCTEPNKWFIRYGTKDLGNSVQAVTDVYNYMVECEPVFGDQFESDGKIKREERMGSFTMRNGIKVVATTIGKSQRGQVQASKRPDWQIFDDVEDVDSVESEVKTAKIIKNCDEAIQGLSVDGTWLLLGNYISDIGVVEYLRSLTAEETITPLCDKLGNPNWDYFTKKKVEQLRNDSLDWWGDYMCDPVTGARREFNKDWFRYASMDEVLKMNTRRFLTIDSAVLKKDEADFSGFTLNFVNDEKRWHFKSWREHLNSAELIDKMFELWDYFNLEVIGLEETTFTMAIQPFIEAEMKKRNKYLMIKPLKHGGINKNARIRGLIPMYKNEVIYHIIDECHDLEGELLRFPKSDNDDTMDSAAYQTQIAVAPEKKEESLHQRLGVLEPQQTGNIFCNF